jgi:hypothetical protein
MMSRKHAVAGVFAAVLLGLAGGASGQARSLGPAPVDALTWTVFSCILPEQAPICIVPIKVKLGTGNKCEFDVAYYIDFDSSRTRRIRWQLQSVDPNASRNFVFGHTAAQKDGIEFTLDVDGDFDNEARSTDTLFRKKLRRAGPLVRPKLFHYDINVEWFDSVGGARTPCDPHGPAIINRG